MVTSVNSHERVAFPLAHIPLTLRAARPKEYKENPATLGEHLKKRRVQAGLFQAQVAAQMRVNEWTYLLWENDRTSPTVAYYPAVIRFLGYDPAPEARSLSERLKRKRWQLGLSIKEAASVLKVDESTLGRWEAGRGEPLKREADVEAFLANDEIRPPASSPVPSNSGEDAE